MYTVKGLESKKHYFVGSKPDCHKHLMEVYPSLYVKEHTSRGQQAQVEQVLPEPLIIRRINK